MAEAEPRPRRLADCGNRIAAALYDVAPVVEVRLDGRAWLDLDGVPRTGQAVNEARRRLRDAVCVEPRLDMAPGPFTAAHSWPSYQWMPFTGRVLELVTRAR